MAAQVKKGQSRTGFLPALHGICSNRQTRRTTRRGPGPTKSGRLLVRHGSRLWSNRAWQLLSTPLLGAVRRRRSGGMGALVDFQRTRWFSDAFRDAYPDRVEAAVEVFLANDTATFAETCRMLRRADLRAAMPGLTLPTDIVVGEEDYATPPEMAEAMQMAIPGATMRVLPGLRHLAPLEAPATIADMLKQLIQT
ncbi:MAG: alpha/beta fold hydrolase [Albidovulum sp.]